MTWIDAVAALAIGILGSLVAAYLWKTVPLWLSRLATKWSERSIKTAQTRLAKLEGELVLLKYLQTNSQLHVGLMFRELAVTLLAYTVIIVCFVTVAAFIALRSSTRMLAKIDPSFSGLDGLQFQLITNFFIGAIVVVLYFSFRSYNRLLKFVDLVVREIEVQNQISKLKTRVAQLSR